VLPPANGTSMLRREQCDPAAGTADRVGSARRSADGAALPDVAHCGRDASP
jgi:hypothetical protein